MSAVTQRRDTGKAEEVPWVSWQWGRAGGAMVSRAASAMGLCARPGVLVEFAPGEHPCFYCNEAGVCLRCRGRRCRRVAPACSSCR